MEKYFRSLMIIFCVIIFIVNFNVVTVTAFDEDVYGIYWPSTPCTVRVRNGLGNYDSSIISAMNKWNSVKSNSGANMITYELGSSSNNIEWSYIMDDSFIGYADIAAPGLIISSFNIYLNGGKSWTSGAASGRYNVETVIIHELGHVLGVNHCHMIGNSCSSGTCTYNVMRPSVSTGTTKTTLQAYDKNSYRNIYS